MIDRDGNIHCSWCGASKDDDHRLRSQFCSAGCATAYRRDEVKRRQAALRAIQLEPIDWNGIRDMVRAPAYFARAAVLPDRRGIDVEAAVRQKLERPKSRLAADHLPDDEIARLNAARRRNGGDMV